MRLRLIEARHPRAGADPVAFAFGCLGNGNISTNINIKMDPSVRWDDGDGADVVRAWIPAFAGMTVMGMTVMGMTVMGMTGMGMTLH
jgi:hypothetical protein